MVMWLRGCSRAAPERCARQVTLIGAHLLQVDPAECAMRDCAVLGTAGIRHVQRIAKSAHLSDGWAAARASSRCSMRRRTYEPSIAPGVSPMLPTARRRRRIRNRFCRNPRFRGRRGNWAHDGQPVIVEGQSEDGVVQGIGTALYEEDRNDEAGQPLVGTVADLPYAAGCGRNAVDHIGHLHTPTPHYEYGMESHGRRWRRCGPPARSRNASATPSPYSGPIQRNPDHARRV